MNAVRVSARAAIRLSKLVEKHNTNSILFSCQSGGCHGFEYKIEPTENILRIDHKIKIAKYVR